MLTAADGKYGAMIKSVGVRPNPMSARGTTSRRALASLIVAIAFASCGGASSTSTVPLAGEAPASNPSNVTVAEAVTTSVLAAGETSVVTSEGEASAAVPELLQFTAPLLGGGEFIGADRAGRATAFWFWAPT